MKVKNVITQINYKVKIRVFFKFLLILQNRQFEKTEIYKSYAGTLKFTDTPNPGNSVGLIVP